MGLNFKEIDDNELVLLIIPSEKVDKVNRSILKYFVDKKGAVCVYTTFTKPYDIILKSLKKEGINTERVFLIDCVTPISEPEEITGNKKVIFCQPNSLMNISISVTTALRNMPKGKSRILILDTISTLMTYNGKNSVIKFIQHLIGEIRKYNVKSFIFTVDETSDKSIISEISRFCDISLKLSDLESKG